MRLILLLLLFLKFSLVNAQDLKDIPADQCIAHLRKVLHEQPEWIKVHAAEYLIWSGHPEGVRDVFQEEDKHFGNRSPYRIGIWRVLAQVASKAEEKDFWVEKIKKAFLDTTGTDRLHAAETLAKLHISPYNNDPTLTGSAIHGTDKPLSIYTSWSVASNTSPQNLNDIKSRLLSGLTDQDSKGKSMIAYAIRHMGNLEKNDWQKLAEKAFSEPDNSPAKVYLLSAAWVTASKINQADPETLSQLRAALLTFKNSKNKAERLEMLISLAEKGNALDLPVLESMFKNENPLGNDSDDADVRAAAAFAILKIGKR